MGWDVLELLLLLLHKRGLRLRGLMNYCLGVEKWLRSSAEIGRVGGRRTSRPNGTGLPHGGAFSYYDGIVIRTKPRRKCCSDA